MGHMSSNLGITLGRPRTYMGGMDSCEFDHVPIHPLYLAIRLVREI